jgi:hypothetical protein
LVRKKRTPEAAHPWNDNETVSTTSTGAVQWPPAPSESELGFWYACGYPHLESGIYTASALAARGVGPDTTAAERLLAGWKTADPVLRRAQVSGADRSVVF